MPKSKSNQDHKTRVTNFKNKIQKMKKEQGKINEQLKNMENGQGPEQMPPIQNVPTWNKDADINVKGYEWELIYNGVVQLQSIAQAAQSVMSNNITNGTIKMDFRKLDPETLTYVAMSDEEKAPYQKEFADIIEKVNQAKTMINTTSIPVAKEEDLPVTNGNFPKQEDIELGKEEKPKAEKKGKLVSMDSESTK